MPPIYSYRCTSEVIKDPNELVWECPYCGDEKPGGPDGDYHGCCGESSAHWVQVPKVEQCGHEYDVLYTSFGAVEREEPLEKCDVCEGTQKERLLTTSSSFILKGRGWFKDGY